MLFFGVYRVNHKMFAFSYINMVIILIDSVLEVNSIRTGHVILKNVFLVLFAKCLIRIFVYVHKLD